MKAKTVLTAGLLAFVAASLVVLVVREAAGPWVEAASPADGFVLYYFHGPQRCPTCTALEAACREVVEKRPAEASADRRLRLESIDFLLSESEEYRRRYDVGALSVVVAEIVDGRTVRWESLDDFWNHVEDRAALVDYLQVRTRAFMETPR
jgi:hypothetical protein